MRIIVFVINKKIGFKEMLFLVIWLLMFSKFLRMCDVFEINKLK